MDNVNKTLYIPLYGKSYVSCRGIILRDAKAEEIWAAEGFPLKGKSASKWLSFYMGMRAAVFDRWVKEKMHAMPDACVLHLGCGMDSRNLRVGDASAMWYESMFLSTFATVSSANALSSSSSASGAVGALISPAKYLLVIATVRFTRLPKVLARSELYLSIIVSYEIEPSVA